MNDNLYGPLIDLLLQDANLIAIIGERIWYGNRPQPEGTPAVRLLTFGNNPAPSKTGVSSVDSVMVGIDVYAKDANTAFEVSRIIRSIIDGLVNHEHQGTILQGVRFLEWEDEPDDEDKSDLYKVYNSYEIRIVRDNI